MIDEARAASGPRRPEREPELAGHPPRAAARSAFRVDINGLRALAVGLVVLFHVGLKGFGGGFIGVDVFFVIPGYLMTRIIERGLDAGTFSTWRFIVARATRIWPALGATVLGCLVAGAFLLPPADLYQLARQTGAAVSFWSNRFFRDHSGYDTQGADGNWFLHSWSLSLEWQFYMLYPLLLAAVARVRWRGRIGAVRPRFGMWLVAALGVASLASYVVQSNAHPNDAFFLLPSRAWQLCAGGLVYWSRRDRRAFIQARWRAWGSYGGLGIILVAALWFGLRHVDPVGVGWRSLLPVAGTMLVLWSDDPDNVFLRNAWVQRLGLASYSIYLWHWPLVVGAEVGDLTRAHPYEAKAALVACALLLGWLSFRFVEAPWARAGARARALGPLAILAVAGAAALVVTATRGLELRMRPAVAGAAVAPALESDYYPARCSNFMKEAKDLTLCTITKDERRRVLVIGDSHAEQLYPWFAAHSQVSVDFLTAAECPPIPNLERLQPGYHCLDIARDAWRAAASPRYDTLVISAHWFLVGGPGPPFCHREGPGACPVVADATLRQMVVRDELRAAIRAVLALGKTVVVLDGVPEAAVKIPQRLERERYWFGEPRLTIDRASLGMNAWIDQLFAELASAPGFHLVSLRPRLCDATTCRVYDAALGRSIYVDESHLAPWWVVRNGDVFSPFVQQMRVH